MHWYWHDLLDICTSVMTLDLRQNIVSAQYLKNNLTDFNQVFNMHSYWQDLAWDCYTSFITHFYRSYGPLFTPKFRFGSISWEQKDTLSLNFIYAFILTRSSLGLLYIIHICSNFIRVYGIKIHFHSISWEQIDDFRPNFISPFMLTRYCLGSLHIIFPTFVPEFWLLIYAKILFPLNILKKNWKVLPNMHLYWQDQGWDCYTSF